MNATQIKYARERAQGIYKVRKGAIEAKYTLPAVTLTASEKQSALHLGNFTTKDLGEDHRGLYYISDLVKFRAEKPEKVDCVAITLETTALDAAYQRLTDQLVLGDSEAALAMLEAFAQG